MKFARFFVTLCVAVLFFFAGAVASAQQFRELRPRPDSPTAMVRCGADLEAVKARLGATRRYVFSGTETLRDMRYCVREATTSVVDERNRYRVPGGAIGWLSADGRKVVLEGCVNDATCEGCPPAPSVIAVVPPSPPTPPPPAPKPEPPPAAKLERPSIRIECTDCFNTTIRQKIVVPPRPPPPTRVERPRKKWPWVVLGIGAGAIAAGVWATRDKQPVCTLPGKCQTAVTGGNKI